MLKDTLVYFGLHAVLAGVAYGTFRHYKRRRKGGHHAQELANVDVSATQFHGAPNFTDEIWGPESDQPVHPMMQKAAHKATYHMVGTGLDAMRFLLKLVPAAVIIAALYYFDAPRLITNLVVNSQENSASDVVNTDSLASYTLARIDRLQEAIEAQTNSPPPDSSSIARLAGMFAVGAITPYLARKMAKLFLATIGIFKLKGSVEVVSEMAKSPKKMAKPPKKPRQQKASTKASTKVPIVAPRKKSART